MAWNDTGGLGDALAELNDAYAELDGLSALTGGLKIAVPVLVGAGTSFGATSVLNLLPDTWATKATIMPYRWLIGGGFSTLVGLGMYKWVGQTEGILTASVGILTALAGWAYNKYMAEDAAAATTNTTSADTITATNAGTDASKAGYQRYRQGDPRQTLSDGGFGRYAYQPPMGNVVM